MKRRGPAVAAVLLGSALAAPVWFAPAVHAPFAAAVPVPFAAAAWFAPAAEEPVLIVLESGSFSGAMALTHAGVGTPPERGDGAQAAADSAFAALRLGAPALQAAIAGTVEMEDDPRYNAGTGANIRLDGKTIQMDAALMTGDGRFAAVAVIERVRNPIRVARAVLDTPHLLLAGDGATRSPTASASRTSYPPAPRRRPSTPSAWRGCGKHWGVLGAASSTGRRTGTSPIRCPRRCAI